MVSQRSPGGKSILSISSAPFFSSLRRYLFCGSLLIFVLSLLACRQPTDPPPPPPPAGPDTTSHDFTWQVDTLGDGNSSVLYDVAIVNDSTIWAVGEMYLKDSSGQIDPTLYNLAKWDGASWSIERLYYPFGGSQFIAPLHSIIASVPNDLWVASNQPMHWTGSSWETFDLISAVWNGWVNRMWGASSSDLYLVGNSGAIAHFDGASWSRVESGTTVDFWDVWGARDPGTGETEVVALASFRNYDRGLGLVRIHLTWAENLDTTGLHVNERGLWFQAGGPYFIAGNGIFTKKLLTDSSWSKLEITPYYSYCIRGNAPNDIVLAGAYGDFLHFNGSSWRQYTELRRSEGSWYGIAIKGNTVAAVGVTGGRAVALIGRR